MHLSRSRSADQQGRAERGIGLDGTGTLLDIGCGPGSSTLLRAPHVARAIGIDADQDMVAEAARRAAAQDLRTLLRTAGDEFTERTHPIVLHLWR